MGQNLCSDFCVPSTHSSRPSTFVKKGTNDYDRPSLNETETENLDPISYDRFPLYIKDALTEVSDEGLFQRWPDRRIPYTINAELHHAVPQTPHPLECLRHSSEPEGTQTPTQNAGVVISTVARKTVEELILEAVREFNDSTMLSWEPKKEDDITWVEFLPFTALNQLSFLPKDEENGGLKYYAGKSESLGKIQRSGV